MIQGKTDVAMLTILRVIDQHRLQQNASAKSTHVRDTINRDAFKVIYVYVLTEEFIFLYADQFKCSDESPRFRNC